MQALEAPQSHPFGERRVEIRAERLKTDISQLVVLMDVLSGSERRQAEAIRTVRARAGFIQARAALRALLAGLYENRPAAVPLEQCCPRCLSQSHGVLSLRGRNDVTLSLSHSSDSIVVAVAYGCGAVGVDCEPHDAVGPSWAEIADRVFTRSERQAIADSGIEAEAHVATRLWCRKEALVKAARRGLLESLQAFDVSAVRADGWTWVSVGPGGYYVRDLPERYGCTAALAVEQGVNVVDRPALTQGATGVAP